jgi:hypothetical protein
VYLWKPGNQPVASLYDDELVPVGETTISWAELVLRKRAELL